MYLYVFITCVNCKKNIFSSVLPFLHFTQLRKIMNIKKTLNSFLVAFNKWLQMSAKGDFVSFTSLFGKYLFLNMIK